jgi:flagellin-like hook-associated protein FlgL
MDVASVMFIMIFMVPITAIVVRSPLGAALARRIGGRDAETERQLLAEVDALRSEVDHLHTELGALHERLDFSERMLASRTESAQQREAR